MQLFYFGWSDSFFSWSRALRFFRNLGTSSKHKLGGLGEQRL